MRANFLELPFEDASFDACYSIEALCYTPDPAEAFREIKRVLKPGACFTFADWVITDKYRDDNAEHRRVRSWFEFGNGLAKVSTVAGTKRGVEERGV